MLLQATLNGALTKDDHPNVPITPDELADDAVACVAAGARAIHMHPRDDDGRETLEARVVDKVVSLVRHACGVPAGVTTGEWIDPDLEHRIDLIRGWRAPDYASVNLSEEGAAEVMTALLEVGVGIEAGVSYIDDVEVLGRSGLSDRITRVLVEPVDADPSAAIGIVGDIHHALDDLGVSAPRLQHGDGPATWVLIDDAKRRGCETRIGLEDTLQEPDGTVTTGNEALVRIARGRFL